MSQYFNKTIRYCNFRTDLRNSGSYGVFAKVSKRRGFKLIFFKGTECKFKDFTDIVKNEKYLLKLFREVWLLKQAEDSGISPKSPRIQLFKDNKYFYIGILMEKIDGKLFYQKDLDPEKVYCSLDGDVLNNASKEYLKITCKKYVKLKMKESNISFNDIHNGNLFVTKKGKIKVIDFSPQRNLCYSETLNSDNFKKEFLNFKKYLDKIHK